MENIVIGQNIVTAKVTMNIAETGINSSNVLVMYSFEPDRSRSYMPGRLTNPLTMILEGKSYLIRALQAMDMTEIFSPPYDGAGGNTIITEDGTPIIPE